MTNEIYDTLLVILSISVACAVLGPILWWILPNRNQSA